MRRILFISKYLPEDFQIKVHGTYMRMRTFIDGIKDIAKIDMLFFVRSDRSYSSNKIKELEYAFSTHWQAEINLFLCPISIFNVGHGFSEWLSHGSGIYNFYNQQGYVEFSNKDQIKAIEDCLERNPDVIFAQRLSVMCPLLLIKKSLPPIFFDMDDIDHVVISRYIKNRNSLKSKFLYMLLPALTAGEYKALKLASITSVCSESDRRYLIDKYKLPGIVTIPNSVMIPKLETVASKPNLLFIGANYRPNNEAAEYLVTKVWPLILEKLPEAKLMIAGTAGNKLKVNIADIPNLEVLGFVENLDNLYRSVRATAVPIKVGGGTRIKIIEAAAYGKPTVSTTVGAEGLEFSNDSEILIRDDPREFADACVKLLSDSIYSENVGLAAREKTIKLYDRNNIIIDIKQNLLNLLESSN